MSAQNLSLEISPPPFEASSLQALALQQEAVVRTDWPAGEMPGQLELEFLPGLGNGFTIGTDTRPPGQEDQPIPEYTFTEACTRRLILIAAEGHALRKHDLRHVPGYQKLLSNQRFADIIVEAATNSLPDHELRSKFVKSMDVLSDNIRNLMDGRSHYHDRFHNTALHSARKNLRRIITLSAGAEAKEADIAEEFNILWHELGLAWREKHILKTTADTTTDRLGVMAAQESFVPLGKAA